MTDYMSPQTNSESEIDSFFSTIVKQKEAEDIVMAGKPAPTSLFSVKGVEAVARTYITGYTTAEEAPSYLDRLEAQNSEDDLTIADKHQILKDSGVKVEYINNFENMNNREVLNMEINRHKKFIDAEDTISRMPLTEQLVGGVMASIGDPVGLAAGIGVGKVFTGVNSLMKMSKMASMAVLTTENAAAAATAVGLSEYMIRKENNTQDQEKLESAIGFGAAFGAGITLLPTAFVGATSLASQAVAATGIKNMMNYKDGSIKRLLTFNTTDSIKLSPTAPDAMKMDAEKAVTSVHGTVDSVGTKVVSEGDTAMGYVSEMVNGVMNKFRFEQNKHALASGTTMDNISVEHKQRYNKFETEVSNAVDNRYVEVLKTEGDTGIYKVYTEATGQEIKVDSKGKVKEPVDLYQVVSNYFKKEIEANGTVKIPDDLKYVHDAYAKFAEEGTKVGKAGLAGKTAFGYTPHTWNDSAIRSRPKSEVVRHIVDMLKNNPLVQYEYSLVAGNKKALAKLDKEYILAAEKKYQDAMEVDMMKTFEGHTSSSDTPRSSKLRKLRVDTSLHPEYFANNIYAELESYVHQMSGQLAMKKYYGIESDASSSINKKLTDLKLKYMQDGASQKDLENWEAMMQSILGTRQIKRDSNTWTSYLGTMLPKTASALWSSGFSMLSLGEVGVVMAKQGVIPTLKAFIPAHKAHLDMIKGMDKNNPNLQYYLDMGSAGMTLRDARHSKFENETRSNHYYAGEQALDSLNHFGRKITFFSHIQDVLDHMAGSAYMNDLFSVIKTGVMSDAQKSKFMRYGLSEDDVAELSKAEWIKKGGKVVDYNFYNWSNKELAKRTHNSLRNAVEDTIVRTDGTRIHRAQSDVNDFVKSLYLQYTNFPMAAYERLLVNFDEVTARTMAGAMASFAIAYSVQELNDAAKVAAGIKDRRASVETIALKSFLNTPFSTIFPTIYDNAASIVGMTTSKGFTPREGVVPTSAGGSALQGIVRNIGKGGRSLMEGEYAEAFANISKVFPIANNIPILNLAFKYSVGQTEKEHNGYRDVTDMSKDPAIARVFKGIDYE